MGLVGLSFIFLGTGSVCQHVKDLNLLIMWFVTITAGGESEVKSMKKRSAGFAGHAAQMSYCKMPKFLTDKHILKHRHALIHKERLVNLKILN